MRADEVEGRHFLDLDIGLPVDKLRPAIRAVLGGSADRREEVVPAVNRRGGAIECTVLANPLLNDGRVMGTILTMEAVPGNASQVGAPAES